MENAGGCESYQSWNDALLSRPNGPTSASGDAFKIRRRWKELGTNAAISRISFDTVSYLPPFHHRTRHHHPHLQCKLSSSSSPPPSLSSSSY
eukprot:1454602-Rhodomonas_salina.3